MRREFTMRSVTVMSVVLVLSVAARASMQSPRNAATLYQQAIERANAFRANSSADWVLVLSYDPASPPTAEYRAALARVQPIIEIARRAAAEGRCDFQIDRSLGVEVLMPHLNPLRQISKMIAYDAYVRMHDGDAAGAAANLADLYRISGHFSGDRTVISSLVGQAVFALVDQTVQFGIDRGTFGAAETQSILDGLATLKAIDPFEFATAVGGEKEMFGGWIEQKLANGEEPEQFLADFMGVTDAEDVDNQTMFMTREYLEHEIMVYNDMMDRMVEIFNMPDRAAAMAEMVAIEDEIERTKEQTQFGGEGLLASMAMPALGKSMTMRNRAETMLASRKELLQLIAVGKSKPEELANAAIWYLRAIERLERQEPAVLDAIRTFAAETSGPMSEELAAALQSEPVRDIIEVLAQGSQKGRCDFTMARPGWWRWGVGLVPPYAPGMHDAVRLLHADAVRMLCRSEEHWEAADRLAMCFRITAHLADDATLLSALISHCNFNKTFSLTQTALDADLLPETVKPVLHDAVAKMKPHDPFGFIGALQTREQMSEYLGNRAARFSGDVNEGAKARVVEVVKSLNGDQLLYVIVVYDTLGQNGANAQTTMEALGRLADVISLPDVEAVQREMSVSAPMVTQYEFEFLRERVIPAIAASNGGVWGTNFMDHMRRAKFDLRRARQSLQPAESSEP